MQNLGVGGNKVYCESGELSPIPYLEKIPILVWGHKIFSV